MNQKLILHHQISGNGSVVVLLPGMLGTISFWEPLTKILSKTHRVISFDPLGFGHSPAPKNIEYTTEDHTSSVSDSLDELKINEPVILIGHSMGALIATRFTALNPQRVKQLILTAPAIFKNTEEAKENIARFSALPKILLYGPIAYLTCNIFCNFLKPLTALGVAYVFSDMPGQIAKDALLHSWHSYSRSLENVIENQNIYADIEKIKTPITIVYGKNDNRIIKKNLEELKRYKNIKNIGVEDEDHQFPIYQPQLLMKIIIGA